MHEFYPKQQYYSKGRDTQMNNKMKDVPEGLGSYLYDQYSAQVVLGRGDNRAASNFLPELFYKGSKTIVCTWMHADPTNCRR